MAEAMIAGLLRGELVAPDQIVASHPRAERRDHLRAEYGIRVVGANLEAIDGADVVLLGIKPQMLARVGREIGPSLKRGQVVLSVLAGATTTALIGTLGHDQVIRAMPNTPARLGKGVTVWYATPDVDAPSSASRRRRSSPPSAPRSRSTTRRWSRWRRRSRAPARRTSSSSWRP